MTECIYFGDYVEVNGLKGYIVPNIYSPTGFSLDLETAEVMANKEIRFNPNLVRKDIYTSEESYLYYDLDDSDMRKMKVIGNAIDDFNSHRSVFNSGRVYFSREALHLVLQRLVTQEKIVPHIKLLLIFKGKYPLRDSPEGKNFWLDLLARDSFWLTEEELDTIKNYHLTPEKVYWKERYPLLEACQRESVLKDKYYFFGAVYNLKGVFGTLVPDKSSITGASLEIKESESHIQIRKYSYLLKNKYNLSGYGVIYYPIHWTEIQDLLYVGTYEDVYMKDSRYKVLLSPIKLHVGLQMLGSIFYSGVTRSIQQILSQPDDIFTTTSFRHKFGGVLLYKYLFSTYCGISEKQKEVLEERGFTLEAVKLINRENRDLKII